jgi:hypothetical protein
VHPRRGSQGGTPFLNPQTRGPLVSGMAAEICKSAFLCSTTTSPDRILQISTRARSFVKVQLRSQRCSCVVAMAANARGGWKVKGPIKNSEFEVVRKLTGNVLEWSGVVPPLVSIPFSRKQATKPGE